MREDLYADFYAVETSHWWFCARRQIVQTLLSRQLVGRRNCLIADVGCGTGANLEMLHRMGRPVGVDSSWRAMQFSRTRGETSLIAGTLPKLPLRDNTFDVVCALDVIEHVEDDAGAVDELARVCKPGGLLFLTVPAYQWLWSGHDVVNEHKRRYTRASLAARLRHPQLAVLKLTYMNALLAPPLMTYRFVHNLFSRPQSPTQAVSDVFAPPAALNRLLFWIFGLERHWLWLSGFPFGISVVGIARKRES